MDRTTRSIRDVRSTGVDVNLGRETIGRMTCWQSCNWCEGTGTVENDEPLSTVCPECNGAGQGNITTPIGVRGSF